MLKRTHKFNCRPYFQPYRGEIAFKQTTEQISTFIVHFPLQSPLPKVWSISQNGKIYCTGEEGILSYVYIYSLQRWCIGWDEFIELITSCPLQKT